MSYRVLHILPWITSGGVERSRLHIVTGLRGEFEHRVICKKRGGAFAPCYDEANIHVDVIPGRWTVGDIESIARIAALIREYKPDIVHGAVFEGVVMASIAGYIAGAPCVIIEETGARNERTWRGDLLFAFCAMISHQCVAVAPHVRSFLSRRSHVREDKLVCLLNGTSLSEDTSVQAVDTYRQALHLPPPRSACLVGSLGRIYDDVKRFSVLIDAFALLDLERYSKPPLLVIGGDGPDRGALIKQVKELGLEGHVLLPGLIEQNTLFYAQLDVFVSMSVTESFGLVVVEAMSAGLPVVVSDIEAFCHIVTHQDTGWIVPREDPAALAEVIDDLLTHPERRRLVGARARDVAREQFSAARYVQDIEQLYRSLLPDGRRRAL